MASHAAVPAWTSNMDDQTLGPPVMWIKEPQMLLQCQKDEMLPQKHGHTRTGTRPRYSPSEYYYQYYSILNI